MSLKRFQRAVAIGVMGLACSACETNLKMHVGSPLEVKRGYVVDFTRFHQNKQEVDRRDVKFKLGRRQATAEVMSRAQTQETLAQVFQAPAFLLLILGVAPSQQADFSSGTRAALLGSGAACLATSITLYAAAESNYVTAVERYNASLPGYQASVAQTTATAKGREEFPAALNGFSFGMQMAAAESLCRQRGGDFTPMGARALCARTARSRPDAPDTRLVFSLGSLTEIVFEYRPPPAQLNEHYGALATSLRNKYGPPQAEPPPLSEACRASLAACLPDSAQKPIIWSWARGSIELLPVWRDERAQIELRYVMIEASL